jgi:hypothetical protein
MQFDADVSLEQSGVRVVDAAASAMLYEAANVLLRSSEDRRDSPPHGGFYRDDPMGQNAKKRPVAPNCQGGRWRDLGMACVGACLRWAFGAGSSCMLRRSVRWQHRRAGIRGCLAGRRTWEALLARPYEIVGSTRRSDDRRAPDQHLGRNRIGDRRFRWLISKQFVWSGVCDRQRHHWPSQRWGLCRYAGSSCLRWLR